MSTKSTTVIHAISNNYYFTGNPTSGSLILGVQKLSLHQQMKSCTSTENSNSNSLICHEYQSLSPYIYSTLQDLNSMSASGGEGRIWLCSGMRARPGTCSYFPLVTTFRTAVMYLLIHAQLVHLVEFGSVPFVFVTCQIQPDKLIANLIPLASASLQSTIIPNRDFPSLNWGQFLIQLSKSNLKHSKYRPQLFVW